MLALMADSDREIISMEIVASGYANSIELEPRRFFARALSLDCRRLMLAHNHPSGATSPSKADIEQTKRLQSQAVELGIELEDHLIVGRSSVFSMREGGLL